MINRISLLIYFYLNMKSSYFSLQRLHNIDLALHQNNITNLNNYVFQISEALPYLSKLVDSCPSKEALMDVLWALSYLSDGDDQRIQTVMNSVKTSRIVKFLQHESSSIITPALRTLGNFVSGNDEQTQTVIKAGVLNVINDLLDNSKRNIRKEACWLISNIAAGTQDQISLLTMKGHGMILQSVTDLIKTAEWEVRKEAAWVICNIATGGTDNEHIHAIVYYIGAIEALSSMLLGTADAKITMVILDAIDHILQAGERVGKIKYWREVLDECDGLEKMEELQDHPSTEIYEKVIYIIERFFGYEELSIDENLMPEVNGDQFAFGFPNSSANRNLKQDMEKAAGEEQQQQQQPLQQYNFTF